MTNKRDEDNYDAQLKESSPEINVKADKTKVEAKSEYYKAIQNLRRESRMQPK